MPGRKFNGGDYKYGFNGMENDNEVKGNGNSVDFGARMYDPRLGRWQALDPLASKYPSLSPYNFVANSPIVFVDPDGRYIFLVTNTNGENDPTIQEQNFLSIMNYLYETTDGKVLLNKYINNNQFDIYITFGVTAPGYLGETIDGNPKANFGSNLEVYQPKLYPELGLEGGFVVGGQFEEEFDGLLILPNRINTFITIDQNKGNVGSELLDPINNADILIHTIIMGHEFGAHVDSHGKTEEEEHDEWGQDAVFNQRSKSKKGSKAESLNNQIKKVDKEKIKPKLSLGKKSNMSNKRKLNYTGQTITNKGRKAGDPVLEGKTDK